MKRLLSIALILAVVAALASSAGRASSATPVYDWRIISGSTTGVIDELQFDPAQVALAITNLPGGGRRASLSITSSGGSGSATNFTAGAGIQFGGSGYNLSIGIDPSLVVTSGAPYTAIAGALGPASTNGLASTAYVNTVSNAIMQVVNGAGYVTNATVLQADPGIKFSDHGGGTNSIGADFAAVAGLASNNTFTGTNTFTGNLIVTGTINAVFTNQLSISQMPSNGINHTSWSGAVFSNGLLIVPGSVVPLTNAASATPALLSISAAGGTLTLTPNTGILTNSGSPPFFWNGTSTISNNATITGTLYVGGALSAGSIAALSTGTVASLNGLISNVVISATGSATVTTTASSNGGTINLYSPPIFPSTNAAIVPWFWSTKYGTPIISNEWGTLPLLHGNYRETDAATSNGCAFYFPSATGWNTNVTSSGITNVISLVNTGLWTFAATNGSLQAISDATQNQQLRMACIPIPNTNAAWTAQIEIQQTTFNRWRQSTGGNGSQFGLWTCVATNGPWYGLCLGQAEGANFSGIEPWVASSITGAGFGLDSAGNFALGSQGQLYYLQQQFAWHQWGAGVILQLSYDGASNLTYSAGPSIPQMPITPEVLGVRTNVFTKLTAIAVGGENGYGLTNHWAVKFIQLRNP